MKTFKENVHKAEGIITKAVTQIAKQDWTAYIAELKVTSLLFFGVM